MELHFKQTEKGEKLDNRLYYGGAPLIYLWRANLFIRAKDRIERIDNRLARTSETPLGNRGEFRKARNQYSYERKKVLEHRVVSLAKKLTSSEKDINAFIESQVELPDMHSNTVWEKYSIGSLDTIDLLFKNKLVLLAGLLGAIAAEFAYLPIIIKFQEPIRKFVTWLPPTCKAAVPFLLLIAVILPGVFIGKLAKGALDTMNLGNVKSQELIFEVRKWAAKKEG